MIERCICYIADKIFHGIMVLLYGGHPSETKTQKLTRWGLALLTIVGIAVLFCIIRTMFAPEMAEFKIRTGPVRVIPVR